MDRIRVLIVDDSALMRKAIKEILETDDLIEVVAAARDGEDAILKAREFQPHVITMDINMPRMDGITSMQYILEELPNVAVLMLSSLTKEGSLTTFEALELGAFDFVLKPSGTISTDIYRVGKEIIEKIKAAYKYCQKRSIGGRGLKKHKRDEVILLNTKQRNYDINKSDSPSKVVVIGISTGGPGVLMDIIPQIPPDINAAIIIIQHMPANFTSSFAERLNNYSQFPIKEAQNGDRLEGGKGYIGKGGYHLLIKQNKFSLDYSLRLTTHPPALFVPSVDITMESALQCFGPQRTIGVLMTGMGSDGAEAMVSITKSGGITIAEDESTAIVYGMPREAIERGGAKIVVPSYKIVDEIIKAVKKV